jgi:hypothetical protein
VGVRPRFLPSFRFPLTLFVISLGPQSQNSQALGLPTGVVMVLILYDRLRGHFARVRNRDMRRCC